MRVETPVTAPPNAPSTATAPRRNPFADARRALARLAPAAALLALWPAGAAGLAAVAIAASGCADSAYGSCEIGGWELGPLLQPMRAAIALTPWTALAALVWLSCALALPWLRRPGATLIVAFAPLAAWAAATLFRTLSGCTPYRAPCRLGGFEIEPSLALLERLPDLAWPLAALALGALAASAALASLHAIARARETAEDP